MNASPALAIGCWRSRAAARQPVIARLAAEVLANEVAGALPALPPQSVLVLRRLALCLPGLDLERLPDASLRSRTAQAARDLLSDAHAHAARPAHELVSESAASVLFADEAELLACLARDALAGRLDRWWWQALLGKRHRDWVDVWRERPAAVPAALRLLARAGLAEAVCAELLAHALPVPGGATEVAAAGPIDPGSGLRLTAAPLAPPADDEQPVRQEALGPEAGSTRRTAPSPRSRSLARTPGRTSSASSSAPPPARPTLMASGQDAPLPSPGSFATPIAAGAQAPLQAGDSEVAEAASGYVPADSAAAAAAPDAPQPAAAAPSPSPTGQRLSDASRPSDEATAQPEATAAAASLGSRRRPYFLPLGFMAAGARPGGQESAPLVPPAEAGVPGHTPEANAAAGVRALPPAPAPAPSASAPEAPALITACASDRLFEGTPLPLTSRYGRLLFLVNLLLGDGLYPDFTRPAESGFPVPIWRLLALLGASLAGPALRGDALWQLLERLAAELPSGDDCAFDIAWPVPPAPVLGHHRPPPAPHFFRLRRTPTHGFARWLARYQLSLRMRLAEALAISPALVGTRLRQGEQTGRLWISEGEIVLVQPLEEHPVAWRLAGLDRDPGYLPSAGRKLRFVFD